MSADQSTINSVKSLINNILSIGQSTLTCDDLFELSLGKEEEGCEEWLSSISLEVKAKTGSPEAQTAAKILSNLTGLFNIQAQYNG